MTKAIAASSAELRGINIALAVDLAQTIGVSIGDYVLITTSSGVKAPGVVSKAVSSRNVCLLSNELIEALGLSEVGIVEVTKPQVEYAKRIYVEIFEESQVSLKNLRTHLYDIPLLNKTRVLLLVGGEKLSAMITIDLGEEGKIYKIDGSTEISIIAINGSIKSGET